MPEVINWYMKEAEGGTHHIELAPQSKWEKILPIVREPKSVLGHLHKKTYFKSTNAMNFRKDKVNLDDI